MIKAYANEHNIVYLDYCNSMVNNEKGLREDYGNDTVHQNVAGYKVMEDLAKEAIGKALRK